jgi:hypothetical protein
MSVTEVIVAALGGIVLSALLCWAAVSFASRVVRRRQGASGH